jgi:hypothetical protein
MSELGIPATRNLKLNQNFGAKGHQLLEVDL